MGCSPSSSDPNAHNNDKKIPSTAKLKLVLETWRYIYTHKNHAGIILIQRLICSDDEIRRVFERAFGQENGDQNVWKIDEIHKHGILVMDTIDVALRSIDDLDNLNQILFELGGRHANYGVQEKMFPNLWEALSSTFKTLLRDAFTKDVKDAWYDVFRFVVARIVYGIKLANKR